MAISNNVGNSVLLAYLWCELSYTSSRRILTSQKHRTSVPTQETLLKAYLWYSPSTVNSSGSFLPYPERPTLMLNCVGGRAARVAWTRQRGAVVPTGFW